MSRAGKNTPASVNAYIDAVWEIHEPPDPIELARELGYDDEAIETLKERHGDKLLRYLEMVRRSRQEELRYLAKQQGQYHPHQYTTSPQGAIEDAACVDDLSQERFTREAKNREAAAHADLLVEIEIIKVLVTERLGARRARHTIHRVHRELDHLAQNTRNKAA